MSPSRDDFAGSDAQYHASAAALLAGIEAQVDRWLEDDIVDIDAARTGGLLELSLPNGSKVVVNMQPPLHEIWLAAQQGGFHFRRIGGVWCDTKTGTDFVDALSGCLSAQAGRPLRFGALAG